MITFTIGSLYIYIYVDPEVLIKLAAVSVHLWDSDSTDYCEIRVSRRG